MPLERAKWRVPYQISCAQREMVLLETEFYSWELLWLVQSRVALS